MVTSKPLREWQHFLRAFYPVFEENLPSKALPNRRIAVQNNVSVIRDSIRDISLQFKQAPLNAVADEASRDGLATAFELLCNTLNPLVRVSAFPGDGEDHKSYSEWKEFYPGLTLVTRLLNVTSQLAATPGQLKQYLLYDELPDKRFQEVATSLKAVSKLLRANLPQAPDDEDYASSMSGNLSHLKENEINFVKKAGEMGKSSTALYSLLANDLCCNQQHAAQMHLSELADQNFNFKMELSTTHQDDGWAKIHFTHFSGVQQQASGQLDIAREPCIYCQCLHSNDMKLAHLGFNEKGIWLHSRPKDPHNDFIAFPQESMATLATVLPQKAFKLTEQREMEIVLANSLLHLNENPWLKDSWKNDAILLNRFAAAERSVARWSPRILRVLDSTTRVFTDHYENITSFGLLLMEIEAGKPLEIHDSNEGWATEISSIDVKLEKALEEWKDDVDFPYRQIAKACGRFKNIVESLYDPGIPESLKGAAAIYKHILAPLLQLSQTNHGDTMEHSTKLRLLLPSDELNSFNTPGKKYRITLFDDNTSAKPSERDIESSQRFKTCIQRLGDKIAEMKGKQSSLPSATWKDQDVRIAIIDTGVDQNDIEIDEWLASKRIYASCGFMGDENDINDEQGHGTHVARLIGELVPSAQLCIAKVSDALAMEETHIRRIAKAIEWACKEQKVHIISMSFGLPLRSFDTGVRCPVDKEVKRALDEAISKGVICFAAASNSGGNGERAYPATRTDVICVHASDGLGNSAGMGAINPNPMPNVYNFSTLGVAVPSRWKGETVWKTGTSFATPIAAAIAANVLEFSKHCSDHDDEENRQLWSPSGISKAFNKLSKLRPDGFNYVLPSSNLEHDFRIKFRRVISEVINDV